MHNSENVLIIW